MKRIVSICLCILMVSISFLGILKVESSAQTTFAKFYLVTSEVASDGTFTVVAYAKDYSPYGWYNFGGILSWDTTKLAPVSFAANGSRQIGTITNFSNFCRFAEASCYGPQTSAGSYVEPKVYMPAEAGAYYMGFESMSPLNFSLNKWGNAAYDFGFSSDYGMQLGIFKFKVRDGATGNAWLSLVPDHKMKSCLIAYSNGISDSMPFGNVCSSVVSAKTIVDVTKQNNDTTVLELDTSDLTCDIDLGGIEGPEISIFGEKFPIMSVDTSLELELWDLTVTSEVDESEQTLKVIIGYGDDASAELKKGNKFNEEYKDLKNLYKYVTGKSKTNWNEYQHLRSTIADKVLGKKGVIGIEAGIQATGYMEFSYKTGKLEPIDCAIIVIGELGASYPIQWPVGFYLTAELKGSAEVGVAVAVTKSGQVSFRDVFSEFKLEAKGGVGLGWKRAKVYAEGGLGGEISLKFSSDFKTASNVAATFTGSLYLEGRVLGLTGEYVYPFDEIDLINKTIPISLFDFCQDEVEYISIDRGYDFSPVAGSNSNVKLFALGDALIQQTEFYQNDVYAYGSPCYERLDDGRRILMWIGDDGTKSDNNRTSLMYSIFDDGVWSVPAVVHETGTFNDFPTTISDGENVFVVWQRSNNPYADDATLETMAASVDLYYSVFDGENFSEPVCVIPEDEESFEMGHSISKVGDEIIISWEENSENDFFSAKGTNSIKLRTVSGSALSDVVVITESENYIVEHLTAAHDDGVYVYYVVREDDEAVLYRYNVTDGIATKLDVADSIMSLSANQNGIYYIKGEELMCFADGTVTCLGVGSISNYAYVTNGSTENLFTLRSDGLKNALYYCTKESNGNFGEWLLYADYDTNIRHYDVIIDDDGVITTAINSVSVDESAIEEGGDVYGSADLFVTGREDYSDLVLNYASFDWENVVPGETLSLNYSVTNNSNYSMDDFSVNLYTAEGELVANEVVEANLGVREKAEFEIRYVLPEDLDNHQVVIKIECNDDAEADNNEICINIGRAELEIDDLFISHLDERIVVSGCVENKGFAVAENVSLSFKSLTSDGYELFEEVAVPVVEAGGREAFCVEVSEFVTDGEDAVVILVEANADIIEYDVANNEKNVELNAVEEIVGDANFDGAVNIIDVTILAQYIAQNGLTGKWDLSVCETSAMDVNSDGEIDQLDINGVSKLILFGETSGESEVSLASFALSRSAMYYGDVDGDGMVNAADALYLSRYVNRWSARWYADAIYINNLGDVDGDGSVTACDVLYLKRYTYNYAKSTYAGATRLGYARW